MGSLAYCYEPLPERGLVLQARVVPGTGTSVEDGNGLRLAYTRVFKERVQGNGGETRDVKVRTSDLGETRAEGSKTGERGGLSYSR